MKTLTSTSRAQVLFHGGHHQSAILLQAAHVLLPQSSLAASLPRISASSTHPRPACKAASAAFCEATAGQIAMVSCTCRWPQDTATHHAFINSGVRLGGKAKYPLKSLQQVRSQVYRRSTRPIRQPIIPKASDTLGMLPYVVQPC